MITNVFSVYVGPLIKKINHPSLLQELRSNIDAPDYKQNIDANLYKYPEKINLIVLIVMITGQHQ